mmetsp:Transcript_38411/g.100544  ORF Transcript_38411/g.100544 Transcript_38411/m.100544 type:complete len:82 (-) Transcript_38411:122-367(-)
MGSDKDFCQASDWRFSQSKKTMMGIVSVILQKECMKDAMECVVLQEKSIMGVWMMAKETAGGVLLVSATCFYLVLVGLVLR